MRTQLLRFALLLSPCLGCNDKPGESADSYLNNLPEITANTETLNRAVGKPELEYSDDQVCSTTRYEIKEAPQEVVMFNADPQLFWPGALIEGDSYASGSPKLLPLPRRAKLNLSISGLFAQDTAANDVSPTASAVNDAIGKLLNGALVDNAPSAQSVFFRQEEAYSFSQAALSLGFSARYLGAKAKGGLSYETNSEQNTVAANATIRTFTITVDPPPTPSAFFDGLSAEELQAQVELGRLSEDNQPVYVASVTYGQIMMFSATSSAAMSELKAALSASFNAVVGGGSATLTAEQEALLRDSSMQVVTLGGSEEGVIELIRTGEPASFFTDATVVSSSVPIAYTLKDLHGNVVMLGETADYDLTTCNPNGFANFYVGNDGEGEVLGFYPDGAGAELASRVTDASHPILDIAVNTLDKLVYVLHRDGIGSDSTFIRAHETNGEQPQNPPFDGQSEIFLNLFEQALAYDPENARLYVAGSAGGCTEVHYGVARTRSLSGAELPTCFDVPAPKDGVGEIPVIGNDVTYVPELDRILVAVTHNTAEGSYGRIEVFDKRGNRLTEEDTFPGLTDPTALAYDANHDRLYVAEEKSGQVFVFDMGGSPIKLAQPFPTFGGPVDLHFDPTYDRLYVVEREASLISVFEPDGSEAAGLVSPHFPGLNEPVALAFRPN